MAEGAARSLKGRLLKIVGSYSRVGRLKEKVPGDFCLGDSNIWGGDLCLLERSVGSVWKGEGWVIYEGSGLPVLTFLCRELYTGKKEKRTCSFGVQPHASPRPGVCG